MSDSDVKAFRLEPRNPLAWALFPVFEERCLAFIEREGIDADTEIFRQELRARFFHPQPNTRRMYLFIDESGIARGHFVAWLDVAWGRPYIHVNQLDVDEHYTCAAVKDGMFVAMDEWTEVLNKDVPDGCPTVDEVSFWTWHEPDVFVRYLRSGCDLKVSRYVLKYSVAERKKAINEKALN
jgi:hypothetical protein